MTERNTVAEDGYQTHADGPTADLLVAERKAGVTSHLVEAIVVEHLDADAVWPGPDPLPSQVSAVMDIVREAMEQAWERGNNDGLTFAAAPQKCLLTNPYRATLDSP
jgi:hypothetical protein